MKQGWEIKRLGGVYEKKQQIKRATKKYSPTDNVAYIDISAIDSTINEITEPTILCFRDAPSRAQQVVERDDILVSLVRPNLKKIAQGEFYATEHAVVCNNIINDIIPLWMYYALRFNNLNRFAQGVAQPGISVSIINEMPLILPPLPLQQEFAKKIEAIEKQKELIRKSIGEVETLFNSRMDYYFSE